ncbi:hypothetical protein [Neisseria meningitidis]|uniref:hypothetical protein n=1 Tax=Neisseria meningitidis TaxID=487 RepID=UPI000FCA410F
MKIYNLVQSFFIISVLTGCMAKPALVSNAIEPVKPVFFIKQSPEVKTYMVSLAGGKLHLDPHGCIRLNSDTSPFIIWASSSELEYTSDGRISITNKFNTSPIPNVCANHGYWIAAPL